MGFFLMKPISVINEAILLASDVLGLSDLHSGRHAIDTGTPH